MQLTQIKSFLNMISSRYYQSRAIVFMPLGLKERNHMFKVSGKMSLTKLQHFKNLRRIFEKSVESVLPVNLLSDRNDFHLSPSDLSGNDSIIKLQGHEVNLKDKKCHVVGFGKAVLGLAVQLEQQLSTHLMNGILSIPKGTLERFRDTGSMKLKENTCIKIFEGAPNNQPDEVAMQAALQIKQLAQSMTQNDILFVLISGGGSALLPLPRSPLKLVEKMELVRQLANKGATIEEMNIVRIALSDIKGGQLAGAARHAHAVISFVISDIVGDPIDLIASGPTCGVQLNSGKLNAKQVLEKYGMWKTISQDVLEVIDSSKSDVEMEPESLKNNMIFVVGNNCVATTEAVKEALKCGYSPFVVSTTIVGNVKDLTEKYSKLCDNINLYMKKEISKNDLRGRFPFDVNTFESFLETLSMSQESGKPMLLISSGEPTVEVSGTGIGGRNQELALRMSLKCYENENLQNLCFLSAGTDGIDGPTDAAGALGSDLIIREYLTQEDSITLDDLRQQLSNNDSYNVYAKLCNRKYHIKTGHTGTNVMDLHFLLLLLAE